MKLTLKDKPSWIVFIIILAVLTMVFNRAFQDVTISSNGFLVFLAIVFLIFSEWVEK